MVERSQSGKRIVFIGLDGAGWPLLDRLTADGTMPRLAAIMRDGDRRILLTQHPPLSPLVWTTMMTGVSPLEHRILDFARFNPVTREKELITSDERAVPAIWNMATSGGRRVGVFGMWATEPPEEVNGTIVSNEAIARGVHEPHVMQRVVAETEAVRRTAVDWIARERPDLAIVYFQGTDEVAHLAGGDIEKARAYFRRIDEIIGELVDLARKEDAEVIIASDHGFDWGGRHEVSSTDIATAGQWHRDEGIFLHWPSSRRGGPPANVQQICSTLLALMGLPHDNRLASRIDGVGQANRGEIDYRRFFRQRPATVSRQSDPEAIARLEALGYIAGNESSKAPPTAASNRTPASFNNEGLILAERQKLEDAERAFEAALAIDPDGLAARSNLADLLVARARRSGGSGAVALLTRSIELRGSDGARLLRARYRLEEHDCSGALADVRAIRAPTALSWASVAAAEGCLGHERAALHAARQSLTLDPNQPALRALLTASQ